MTPAQAGAGVGLALGAEREALNDLKTVSELEGEAAGEVRFNRRGRRVGFFKPVYKRSEWSDLNPRRREEEAPQTKAELVGGVES